MVGVIQCAKCTEQIESVLDLSQSEAGMLPLAHEEFELLPFVQSLAEDRSSKINAAGLTLDLRADKSAGRMTGDRRRLGRAIGHLIDNAIAATPRGGRVLLELGGHKGKARPWSILCPILYYKKSAKGKLVGLNN